MQKGGLFDGEKNPKVENLVTHCPFKEVLADLCIPIHFGTIRNTYRYRYIFLLYFFLFYL
jgi:hypothetical protein